MALDQSKRRALYVLRFDEPGHELAGLTVGCRKPGYRATRMLERAVLALGEDLSGERGGSLLTGDALLAAWAPLFAALQKSVQWWDLIDNGRAVPVSALLDQDTPFLLMVARTWYDQVVLHQPGTPPATVDDDEPVAVGHHAGEPENTSSDEMASPITGVVGVDEEWLAQLPAQELLDTPEGIPELEDIPVPDGPVLAGAEV